MSLSNDQVIKAVKSPPNQSEVRQGVKQQSRLRVLTLPLGAADIDKETAWDEAKRNLASKLSVEKYNAIIKYYTFPLSIVNISKDMALDLFKVFDGRNAVFSNDYPNDRLKETANAMFADMDINGWIEEEGKKVLSNAPNTIVVIDKDQNGDPVLLAVTNERLEGYELDKKGNFKYIVFLHSEGVDENGVKWVKHGVYDDMNYNVVTQINGVFTNEVFPHSLGSCPARFFFDNPLINKHKFKRAIPFSPVVGVMGQWQTFDLFDFYQDHFAAFQVVQYADSGCDNDCTNGKIYHRAELDEDGIVTSEAWNEECSTCANKQLIGPGSSIGVQVSTDSTEQDTRDVFSFVSPDIAPLEYVGGKQKGRERFMKENVVGFSDAINNEAVNETQIKALVESRKKPLLFIKTFLQDLDVWIHESTVKLVYNAEMTRNSNYGTEWFILGVDEILKVIEQAKISGAQSTYIQNLNMLLISTEYKGDPNLTQYMLISADLEPNPYDSQQESRDKFKEGMMTAEDYYIKSNFTDLLGRFQRENGSIVNFGSELSYNDKINRIKQNLIFYTNQKLVKNEQESTDDEAQPTSVSDTGA